MRLHALMSTLVLLLFQAGSQPAPLTVVGSIDLPGVEGRIDHLAYDAGGQRLFVAALGNNTVEVLDLKNSTHLKTLPGFREPQGIAMLPDVSGWQSPTVRAPDSNCWMPVIFVWVKSFPWARIRTTCGMTR
ncbi:MAG: hypothetical protein H0W68_14890 [Gemmatimonadaceae bacterium]|nr:hypothetical protein [Gemmatimonadaceae bacterium]